MRPKITLDTNCIYAIQENREEAIYIRELLSLYREGKISLQIVAIAASEKKMDGTYPKNFEEFKEKLENLGLEDFVLLPPLGGYDVTFYGYCLYADGNMEQLSKDIQNLLFPTSPENHAEFCKAKGVEIPFNGWLHPQWRNQLCDVMVMWGHIYHGGDVFVTSDKNFHKPSRKESLISLGAKHIVFPNEALPLLSDVLSISPTKGF